MLITLDQFSANRALAEFLTGNTDPAIRFFGIDPNKNATEPRQGIFGFDSLKEDVACQAFETLLELEKAQRLNPKSFKIFSQEYYGSSHPRLRRGTGISGTTLMLLKSMHQGLKLLRESSYMTDECIAQAIQYTSEMRVISPFAAPMVLFETSNRKVRTNTGMNRAIFRNSIKDSDYWYDYYNEVVILNWKSYLEKTKDIHPGCYSLALLC